MTWEPTAILFDFENLVLGLEASDMAIEPGLFFRLAEEEGGRVVVAAAYADWQHSKFNRYQRKLYEAGIELVHVLGRGHKNAVDLRLAVDAIEMLFERPHIQSYMLVSGDRDFIHVLKVLRKHDKRIVGVAPKNSTSRDLAELCDRFVTYSALWRTHQAAGRMPAATASQSAEQMPSLSLLKAQIRRMFREHVGPDGVLGAALKQLMRRHISRAFDESTYGFSRFATFVRSMPDVLHVGSDDRSTDIRVYVVDGHPDIGSLQADGMPGPRSAPPVELDLPNALLRLKIDWDGEERARSMHMLHEAMVQLESFDESSLAGVVTEGSSPMAPATFSDYFRLCEQSSIFTSLEDGQMSLDEVFLDKAEFIFRLERSLLYKAASVLTGDRGEQIERAARILDLSVEQDQEYVEALLDQLAERIEQARVRSA